MSRHPRDIRNENPLWVCRTPNEEYRDSPEYRDAIRTFKRQHAIPGRVNFVKVRLVKPKASSALFVFKRPWWEDSMWTDKLFWVFQSPSYERTDGAPYGHHVLELFESRRVLEAIRHTYAADAFQGPEFPAFTVPVECCQAAWSETSAGYSDHLTGRHDPVLSTEALDKLAATAEAVAKLTKQIEELDAKELETKWQ